MGGLGGGIGVNGDGLVGSAGLCVLCWQGGLGCWDGLNMKSVDRPNARMHLTDQS
jgi:hypothetical protein